MSSNKFVSDKSQVDNDVVVGGNKSKNKKHKCIICKGKSVYTDINDTSKKYCVTCIKNAHLSVASNTSEFYQACSKCFEHIGTSFTGESGTIHGVFDQIENFYYHSGCIPERIHTTNDKREVVDLTDDSEDVFVPKKAKRNHNSSSSSLSSSNALEEIKNIECTICRIDITCKETGDLKPVFCQFCDVTMHISCKKQWGDIRCPACKREPTE